MAADAAAEDASGAESKTEPAGGEEVRATNLDGSCEKSRATQTGKTTFVTTLGVSCRFNPSTVSVHHRINMTDSPFLRQPPKLGKPKSATASKASSVAGGAAKPTQAANQAQKKVPNGVPAKAPAKAPGKAAPKMNGVAK